MSGTITHICIILRERERTVRMILFPIAPVRLLASVKLWKVSPFPHL